MRLSSQLVAGWRQTQVELARRVRIEPLRPWPRLVAAADCAFTDDGRRVLAVALVWDAQARDVVECTSVERPLDVPYVPGYLSFREGPAILEALSRLKSDWGVACFDGQGIAHPRRCGLATHLGVTLDRPAVGFAKSRLIGVHDVVPSRRGERADLRDDGEIVGAVLCTRDRVRPIYVSVGHRLTLDDACDLALQCSGRFRIPEPTRSADRHVARLKRLHEARPVGRCDDAALPVQSPS